VPYPMRPINVPFYPSTYFDLLSIAFSSPPVLGRPGGLKGLGGGKDSALPANG
jgi:hypothetical protein